MKNHAFSNFVPKYGPHLVKTVWDTYVTRRARANRLQFPNDKLRREIIRSFGSFWNAFQKELTSHAKTIRGKIIFFLLMRPVFESNKEIFQTKDKAMTGAQIEGVSKISFLGLFDAVCSHGCNYLRQWFKKILHTVYTCVLDLNKKQRISTQNYSNVKRFLKMSEHNCIRKLHRWIQYHNSKMTSSIWKSVTNFGLCSIPHTQHRKLLFFYIFCGCCDGCMNLRLLS